MIYRYLGHFCPSLKQANVNTDLRGQGLRVQLERERGRPCQSFCQVSARGKNYFNQFISRLGQMHLQDTVLFIQWPFSSDRSSRNGNVHIICVHPQTELLFFISLLSRLLLSLNTLYHRSFQYLSLVLRSDDWIFTFVIRGHMRVARV